MTTSLLLATACSAPPSGSPLPPLPESAAADWSYAVRVLDRGDLPQARRYFERAVELGPVVDPDRAQFFRDLAEVRLASGDPAGAAAAVHASADALARLPANARFRDSERSLFQRTLDALEAAANDDAASLEALTADASPPLGDAWYLLGWVREQHGDVPAASVAYQAYLDRSPAWSFLRFAPRMRQHAQAFLSSTTR
jgi:tetratricopeptide (TPR) repeat protein